MINIRRCSKAAQNINDDSLDDFENFIVVFCVLLAAGSFGAIIFLGAWKFYFRKLYWREKVIDELNMRMKKYPTIIF